MGDAANYEPMIPSLDAHTYTYVFAECSPTFVAMDDRGTSRVSSRLRRWPTTHSASRTTLDGDASTSSVIP